jgi:septum formation protein
MASAQLLLASASPRRGALLDQLGIRYQIHPAELHEVPHHLELPDQYVKRLAAEKSLTAQTETRTALPVLGADTEVVLDGEIFGKPEDEDHALSMLKKLSGREHFVLSAVSLRYGDQHWASLNVSQVLFRPLEEDEIRAYWQTGEPLGKAGAYAIQGLGSLFIDRLAGSFSGVMGLPLRETSALLQRVGINPLANQKDHSVGE